MTSSLSIGVLRTRFQPQTVRSAVIRPDHPFGSKHDQPIRLVKSLNQRSDEEFNL
jgi:hypothetical protein